MYYSKMNINGANFHLAVNIAGEGAPTPETEGNVGMLYMNRADGLLYKCTEASSGRYVWKPFEAEKQNSWIDTPIENGQKYILKVGQPYKIIPKSTTAAGVLSIVAEGAGGEGLGTFDVNLSAYFASGEILFTMESFEKYNETEAQVRYTINETSAAVRIPVATTSTDVPEFRVHGEVIASGANVFRSLEHVLLDIEAALRS